MNTTTAPHKKITLATLKSFIRHNRAALWVNQESSFDGMVDCVMPCDGGFTPARETGYVSNTLGISGVWVVGGAKNWFVPYCDGEFTGIRVYNCCGSFIVAIKNA